jgi:hypothetical protein
MYLSALERADSAARRPNCPAVLFAIGHCCWSLLNHLVSTTQRSCLIPQLAYPTASNCNCIAMNLDVIQLVYRKFNIVVYILKLIKIVPVFNLNLDKTQLQFR